MYNQNGFGVMHISWSDIKDWQDVTGTRLNIFESTTIMTMSKAFVSYYNEVNEKIVPPPYHPEDFDRKAVSNQAASLLRSLAARKRSRVQK